MTFSERVTTDLNAAVIEILGAQGADHF